MSFLDTAEKDGTTPELFVLDLNLPKIDGFAILKHLRASSHFAHLPVIVLSSGTNRRDREECESLGARYLQKGIAMDDFIKIGGVVKGLIDETRRQNDVKFPTG